MYERNAIVLERYLNKIFEQKNGINFKDGLDNLKDILEETEKYLNVAEEEEKIIEEFEKIAKKMQSIQKKQEELCLENIKCEEEKNKLFNDLDDEPLKIESKLLKLEEKMQDNFEKQKVLREEYIELLKEFVNKQQRRNKCAKEKRIVETNHIKVLNGITEKLDMIEEETVAKINEFIELDNDTLCQTLEKVILDNGKNEKIKFNQTVIKKAVEKRILMAKKEAECYITIYEKLKRLMTEIENDNFKLKKYQKTLRDCTAKLNFLNSEKEYIANFLDNERMASINGEKIHKEMMKEACKNFDLDIKQIENLYLLIIREIASKSTKKAYKELYNATYLKNIEETEKTFNKEVNSIKANIGTIINSNYWRIDGIKNIYEVFNHEIQENFEKDLSEFIPQEETISIEEERNLDIIEQDVKQFEEENDDIEEWFISNEELQKKEEIQENDIKIINEEKKNNVDDIDDIYEGENDDDDYEKEYNDDYDEDYDDDDYDDYEEDYDDDYEDYEEEPDEDEKFDTYDKEEKVQIQIPNEDDKDLEEQNEENGQEKEKSSGIFGRIFKDKKK